MQLGETVRCNTIFNAASLTLLVNFLGCFSILQAEAAFLGVDETEVIDYPKRDKASDLDHSVDRRHRHANR